MRCHLGFVSNSCHFFGAGTSRSPLLSDADAPTLAWQADFVTVTPLDGIRVGDISALEVGVW
jgi:hypothetical protein